MTSMRLVLSILLAGCSLSANLAASSLQLSQSGWQLGGPLTVSFAGTDANHNGQLDLAELTAFSATYQLPQGGSTTWSIGDLQTDGFFFADLGNFLFAATNANYILIDSSFQGQALGSVADVFLFPGDQTVDSPTAVPEPSGLAWAGLAMIAIWSARDRKNL